ncbi:hypothetical protein [Corallincola spongiicola]|uniref:Acyltransferase 3 domain-containing protein n=1 Tax=Corallincola spongiicola TaxID=2520508 RepID=A0ABY1WSS5_9GAMM|nr:hypothetical protein [Corallincola spongiicola]TAA47757.1 hypothetical protein EXY25_00460 [Corallincola spongiicola]
MELKNSMLSRYDITLLLRAFSIFAIVAGHFKFMSLGGGAFFLIALSGYNFVKFTLPKLNRTSSENHSAKTINYLKPYFRFVFRIILPTLLYLIVLYTYFGEFHWLGFFFLSNFSGPNYAGGFSYWFLDVLIQIYIAFSFALIIKPIREYLFNTTYIFFLIGILVSFLIRELSLSAFDTENLMNRLPHLMIYIFFIGGSAAVSDTLLKKSLTTVVVGLVCFEAILNNMLGYESLLFFGVVLTIWIPYIYMPNILIPIVNKVAMASLFIYLSHFQARSLLQKIVSDPTPLMNTFFAIFVGILLSLIWKNRKLFIDKTWPFLIKRLRFGY